MINFLRDQSASIFKLLLCSVAALILQGCGAERSTPFSPIETSSSCSSSSSSSSSSSFDIFDASSSSSSSSSSQNCSSSSSSSSSSSLSSSSASSVQTTQLWSATNTISEVSPAGKNVQAITTANEFDKIIGGYMDPLLLGSTDYFTDGQVILVYDGEVNNCLSHLEFNGNINAYDFSSTSVKVTLGYFERAASSNCSPTISHPFSLYQIKTKKLLIFEEKIQ